MSKSIALQRLYEQYKADFASEEIVTGDGNADSGLLLIGEAPGKDEVMQGKPFVGTAGRNLAEFLDIIGLTRESIYITNAIKYRLSKVSPKTGSVSNRPAMADDINKSREYLLKEIGIIKPQYIVTLGNVPLRAVTGDKSASIGELHGSLKPVYIGEIEYKLFPLYHPASIIYNKSLKEVYLQDIKKLKDEIMTAK